jgi:hypothetical protein
VAWVSASGKGQGTFRNGGFWPASPTQLFAGGAVEVSLAGYPASGTGAFVAGFTVYDGGSSVPSLWVVPSAGSANARSWGAAVLGETGALSVREPGIDAKGSGVAIHWTQADASGHEVLVQPYNLGAQGATQVASAPVAVPGGVADVRLAANAFGDVMAVWTQDKDGATSVYASLHRATGWSAATLVVPNAYWPDVASNGTGFLVVASAASPTAPATRNLVAVPYDSGTFGPAEVVVTSTNVANPRVASDGAGYAAIWQNNAAVQGAVRNGGAWLTTQSLGTGPTPAVAGRPGEYLFAWIDNASSYAMQRRASGSGGSWSWTTVPTPTSLYAYRVAIAAGPNGFAVAFRSSGDGFYVWPVVGGVSGSSVYLGYGTKATNVPCVGPRIAFNGTRYAVGWNCSDGLRTNDTDGVSAATYVEHVTGNLVFNPVLAFGLGGSPDGRFRIVYSRPSGLPGTPASLYGKEWTGSWSPTATLESRAESTQSSAEVTWDGGAYLAAWTQSTAASPIVDDLVSLWAY